MILGGLLAKAIFYYEILIIAYILMSWLRPTEGLIADIYRVLGTLTEPWLGIFRRIVPPIGMIDISPIVALIALRLIAGPIIGLLDTL